MLPLFFVVCITDKIAFHLENSVKIYYNKINSCDFCKGGLNHAAQRTYLAIDLKSFYASVECVDRHLDPLTTNLVVADASRTEKTICLAVSPSLKAYKIPGRARLFEAVQRVKEVNAQRLQTAIRQKKAVRGEDGKYHFASTSFDANALNADPALGLSYIVAPPRMQRYLDVSTQIYKTYLRYVSPADIYPYSIDEVFIDVTGYLPYYHMSAHELAMTMVREVLYNTGITATAGIGTNLYLAKLAITPATAVWSGSRMLYKQISVGKRTPPS